MEKPCLHAYNPFMTAFVKMHGLGNDFVVFDARDAAVNLTPAKAKAVARPMPELAPVTNTVIPLRKLISLL